MRGRGHTDSQGRGHEWGPAGPPSAPMRDPGCAPQYYHWGEWEQEKRAPWEILLLHTGIAMRERVFENKPEECQVRIFS